MINYKNGKTQFQLTETELTEHICVLIIFCNMNPDSEQANKLKKQLEQLEKALVKGAFKK